MNEKKLYKSRDDKWFGGVCGGIGEYFDVDSIIIRIVAIILGIVTSGILIFIYLLLCFLIPYEPIREYTMHSKKFSSFYSNGSGVNDYNTNFNAGVYNFEDDKINKNKNQQKIGLFLVVIGVILFLGNILPKSLSDFIVPVCLLIVGLLLIISSVPFKQKNKNIDYDTMNNINYNNVNDSTNKKDEFQKEQNINKAEHIVKEGNVDKEEKIVKEEKSFVNVSSNAVEETKEKENDSDKGEFTIDEIKKMREEGSESHE
ncbi:PspC domain-containing protein [Anaerofustis sp. NSJ-163]|uniref:PspC domain-containing protein n=1 Tax=Anaerofustis sp. NSJ-163 TaxID=2944391 RepID=UPI00209BF36F|nr:PspC domain-containing protein [Anaerofustis sp. NSJ-163]MCO8194221.1 PspC domain-containing protein [Anaerofustis sp. NSJ-163]